jgi:hypothetical protein
VVLCPIGHNAVKPRVDEFHSPVRKISEILEQGIVVGADERVPVKLAQSLADARADSTARRQKARQSFEQNLQTRQSPRDLENFPPS